MGEVQSQTVKINVKINIHCYEKYNRLYKRKL